MGNAAGAAGLAHLMVGDGEAAEWFHRAAARYRESWEDAPPGSWGRPIGAIKSLILAGDWAAATEAARWPLEAGAASGHSPTARYAVGLVRPGHEEQHLVSAAQRRHGHRDPVDERLQLCLRPDDAPRTLLECRLIRVQGRDVAVASHAEQDEVEHCVVELPLVRVCARVLAELAGHPVHGARLRFQLVEQRLLRHAVVRPLVPGRNGALVAPPELGAAPVRLQSRGERVRVPWRRAARQHDAAPAPRSLGESLGNDARRIVRYDDLDIAVHGSPAASSRERSIAAWIAFRNAARTPPDSSSRIAAIVVPPGDVTASRSSTGCSPTSRSCFAVPSIVCTTSCVEISRERLSSRPASIIASASRAKYAGPEPEIAVTASIAFSGTRTTAPRCESVSSASARCSSPACAPAHKPAIPSCTIDGAFGIARQTGTSGASRASIRAVGTAAATDNTVCSSESSPPISPSSESMSCGFTVMTTSAAPTTASAFERVASTPYRSRSSATRSSRRVVTTMSFGSRQPELSSPDNSASPILPAPMIAIRRSSTAMRGSLCRSLEHELE